MWRTVAILSLVLSLTPAASTTAASGHGAEPEPPTGEHRKDELILYNSTGHPTAYIASRNPKIVFLWSGEPVAYLAGQLLYGFNGHQPGMVPQRNREGPEGPRRRLHQNRPAHHPKNAPVRGPKRPRPVKTVRQPPKLRPPDSVIPSPVPLEEFLKAGRRWAAQ